MDAVERQRGYYQTTAEHYDVLHMGDPEHQFALAFMISVIEYFKIGSVLDVGSGTGRALFAIKHACKNVRILGIEPSAELRNQGYRKGLGSDELIDGDATNLHFAAGEFDLVCEFGVLHHIKDHKKAVSEMLRVAKKAIFISDNNTFGWGSPLSTLVKRSLKSMGLWNLANLIATRGRGYMLTEDDGVSYRYSVFDDFPLIKQNCDRVHLLNTKQTSLNFYRTASHVAVLGLKKFDQGS
jgi:SAM-dependent methyltransferase